MARYIDISIPTDALTTVFPGDPAPEISRPAY
jgi:kynurenine formamidase